MFKQSLNINHSNVNYFDDLAVFSEICDVSRTAGYQATVESIESFPNTSSLHSSGFNVQVENSSNTCKYSDNVLNNGLILSVNDKSKHSSKEFYNHCPKNKKKNSGTCARHTSYKIKLPRDVLTTTLKKKRTRTLFTTEQIIALEEVFHKKPYINREERMLMMKKLQVSEKSIKVWFQNRRRLTDKRSKDDGSDSPSSEDMSDTFLDRLTLIESNINQNTDVYGYVRLDNSTMNELVNVIDEYLSQDLNSHVEEITPPIVEQNIMIYEPISPVSLTEDSEEVHLRCDFETQPSQQFTDIESSLFF